MAMVTAEDYLRWVRTYETLPPIEYVVGALEEYDPKTIRDALLEVATAALEIYRRWGERWNYRAQYTQKVIETLKSGKKFTYRQYEEGPGVVLPA